MGRRLKTEIRYPAANASQPVIIRLFKQRVWCRTCNKRSMAQSDLVGKYCCISQHSKLKILSALTEDRSMTSIARENNVSVNTVQRVLGSCSHQFNSSYDYLPEHLAFDEFKGVDRTLHFICLDADKHEVVQILRTRYKKAIIAYCKKFSPAAKQFLWTWIFTIKTLYEHAFPTLSLCLIAFTWYKCLRVPSTPCACRSWRNSKRPAENTNCLNHRGNCISRSTRHSTKFIRITIGTTKTIWRKSR